MDDHIQELYDQLVYYLGQDFDFDLRNWSIKKSNDVEFKPIGQFIKELNDELESCKEEVFNLKVKLTPHGIMN